MGVQRLNVAVLLKLSNFNYRRGSYHLGRAAVILLTLNLFFQFIRAEIDTVILDYSAWRSFSNLFLRQIRPLTCVSVFFHFFLSVLLLSPWSRSFLSHHAR